MLSADLIATLVTFSGTEGDTGQHIVTDAAVVHSQTHTFNITNPFPAKSVKGLIIASFDPIYLVPGPTGTQYNWTTSLVVDGIDQDPRGDTLPWDFATADQNPIYIPLRALLGQLVLAGGATSVVTLEKTIENGGPSQTWEFNMGGDKVEAVML